MITTAVNQLKLILQKNEIDSAENDAFVFYTLCERITCWVYQFKEKEINNFQITVGFNLASLLTQLQKKIKIIDHLMKIDAAIFKRIGHADILHTADENRLRVIKDLLVSIPDWWFLQFLGMITYAEFLEISKKDYEPYTSFINFMLFEPIHKIRGSKEYINGGIKFSIIASQ